MGRETLAIVITGHVDHGKSTLIGRLLFDTDSVPKDKLLEIETASKATGKKMDFAFFVDQFREERERLMTLDTSRIVFRSRKRDYVIIDSPGHEELIKNMMTGASSADAAVMIVGAAEGVEDQTKRHAHILTLLGFKELILLVNKMDLAGYAEARFREVLEAATKVAKGAGLKVLTAIPISAAEGDSIAHRSRAMKWYRGPTFLEALDRLADVRRLSKLPARFSVQDLYKMSGREVAVGRVESGILKKGEELVVLPSSTVVKIRSIEVFGKSPSSAREGECVGLILDPSGLAAPGSVLCLSGRPPKIANSFTADICVLSPRSLPKGERVMLRLGPQETPCVIEKIERCFDPATLTAEEKEDVTVGEHKIGTVCVRTDRPVVAELFSTIPSLGRFILEDPGTGTVLAAGVIRDL